MNKKSLIVGTILLLIASTGCQTPTTPQPYQPAASQQSQSAGNISPYEQRPSSRSFSTVDREKSLAVLAPKTLTRSDILISIGLMYQYKDMGNVRSPYFIRVDTETWESFSLDWDRFLSRWRASGRLEFTAGNDDYVDNLGEELSWWSWEVTDSRPAPDKPGWWIITKTKLRHSKKVFKRVIYGFYIATHYSNKDLEPGTYISFVQFRQWLEKNLKDEGLLLEVDKAKPIFEKIDPDWMK